jgi:extradiol dioxygenase family protein
MPLRPFHVAVPVHDLTAARDFYGRLLGCPEGRSAPEWVDFDLFGHQFVCHLSARVGAGELSDSNVVDGHDVPVPHYGVVLSWSEWERLAARLTDAHAKFIIEPTVRFVGQPGEQATLFLCDPSGNALEFKAMRDEANLFTR